ncbi:hypothetical protein BH09PSE1_BH09PSE1_21000 [soil metagenome]
MTAVACLRVLLDGNRTDLPADALGPLVAKYANIFLEVRWTFPRLSQQLNHYSYLLTDPIASELDTVELAHLSQELQARLFGTGIEDAVKLVLFEGTPEAIDAFAGYSADDVLAAMDDPSGLPAGGRLRRIAADGSLIDVPEIPTSPPVAEAFRLGGTIDGAQGIYFPAGGAFIGDVLNCTPLGAATYYSMVDGEDHRPDDAEAFDAACVMTAVRFLIDFPITSPLYVPIAFSTLVRPSQREAWLDLAAVLPAQMRNRLSASVYDVPRSPTWQALSTIRTALDPHFSAVDLCVRDPDFQIQNLTERAVASVTLVLPEAKPDVRLAALRRFASHAPDYRKRRIASGVTNIRFRTERELAIELRVPFLSGPGVCRIQSEPVGGRSWPIATLPLLTIHTDGSTTAAA